MALFNQALASITRWLHQAWHTIPLWEKPDGTGVNAQADASGSLYVTGGGGGSLGVEGVVDDDAAVGTTKPIVIGGVYYSDPSADTIDDGDAGYALLNNQRMLVVEDRAYDSTSDADKNIPVWNPTDLWEPEDLSDSLGADGTVTKYVVLEPNSRWSLQFIPTVVDGETITLTVAQSNEDTGDVATQTYSDVTNTFFGTTGFTAETWIEPEDPTAALTLRVQVTVSNYSSGTPSWDLFADKRSNS